MKMVALFRCDRCVVYPSWLANAWVPAGIAPSPLGEVLALRRRSFYRSTISVPNRRVGDALGLDDCDPLSSAPKRTPNRTAQSTLRRAARSARLSPWARKAPRRSARAVLRLLSHWLEDPAAKGVLSPRCACDKERAQVDARLHVPTPRQQVTRRSVAEYRDRLG